MRKIIKKKNNKEYPWFKYYKNGIKAHLDYPDVSMYEMIRRAAIKHPSNIAYTFYGTRVTYKSYLRKIDEAACAFAHLGVVKGDYVSMIMPNTPEAITCFYALNKIGCIVNMIHPLSSEEELKYGINLTNSTYVMVADIAFEKLSNILDETNVKKVVYAPVCESMDPITKIGYKLTTGRKSKKPSGNNVIPYYRFISRAKFYKQKIKDNSVGSDIAAILHSGGTTGTPKGIVLTNLNFNALAIQGAHMSQVLGTGVSLLAIMPIFHGFGLGVTFHATMISADEAIILPTVNPKKFDETILKYKPNAIACVPGLLSSLPKSKKLIDADLSFIKCVLCGGDFLSESLNTQLDEFFHDHGCDIKIRTAYGMTECCAGATMMPPGESRLKSIGIPLSDCIVKIINPDTNLECKFGEIGEICVNSPTVMKGYLNEEKETKLVLEKDKDGNTYLHTGDLGYMDKDGFVYFESRLKRMIVSSGYNIYPGQIEKIINEHPYVDTCVVVGVPHPYKKEVVKAYIVLKKDIELTSEVKKSIKEHCERNIASYSLPYAYGYRKELPKTKLGKVAYRDLINNDEGESD